MTVNRYYASRDDLADRDSAWLDGMSGDDHLRRCSLQTSRLVWLSTWLENIPP